MNATQPMPSFFIIGNFILFQKLVAYSKICNSVLADEVRNGLSPGINLGVIELPHFRLGVLICADLWEPFLLYKLIIEQKADIIAVPAWTNTLLGHRDSARIAWYSLTRAESISYSVPIVVADHLNNNDNHEKYDVGNATIIFS